MCVCVCVGVCGCVRVCVVKQFPAWGLALFPRLAMLLASTLTPYTLVFSGLFGIKLCAGNTCMAVDASTAPAFRFCQHINYTVFLQDGETLLSADQRAKDAYLAAEPSYEGECAGVYLLMEWCVQVCVYVIKWCVYVIK